MAHCEWPSTVKLRCTSLSRPQSLSSLQTVPPHHATLVFDAYGSSAGAVLRAGRKGVQKSHIVFPGDHNETRPAHFLDSAAGFLVGALKAADGLMLPSDKLPRDQEGYVASIQHLFDKLKLMQTTSRAFVASACCLCSGLLFLALYRF